MPSTISNDPLASSKGWQATILQFQRPSPGRAAWQLLNTGLPYAALWYAMYRMLEYSYWGAVLMAIPTGAMLIRVFIILHDCGHGSFFKSRRANDVIGFIAGVLTFTPYQHWAWQHAIHHGTAGQLDNRGTGDIWTMTVREYLAASRWRRSLYRLARNPIVLFGIAPIAVFVFQQRVPSRDSRQVAPTRSTT
jgi:omega-6 fatty acid desaturase (delta-12 desaturase)